MRIAIASDHAGFALKEQLRERLAAEGHDVQDFGTTNTESTDYPDYASLVAHEVAGGRADRGVLVCSTGIGMSIAANKVEGVRAALVMNDDAAQLTRQHNDANVIAIAANKVEGVRAALVMNDDAAQLTRQHNDANVIAIAARYTDAAQAAPLVDKFLNTEFEGGRHARRVAKIARLEEQEKRKST